MTSFYLCSGVLYDCSKGEIPTNIKVNDLWYWGHIKNRDYIDVCVEVWSSKGTKYKWHQASSKDIALIKTHVLLAK